MMRHMGRWKRVAGGVFSLGWWVVASAVPEVRVVAQSIPSPPQQIAQQSNEVLTKAEIYKLQNRVELLPFNQSARPARLSDVLVPQDALRTASAAIAELLFNEGSIARVDANTVFRFRQGLRRFQLPNRVSMRESNWFAQIPATVDLKRVDLKRVDLKWVGDRSASKQGNQHQATQINGMTLAAANTTLQRETIFVLESGTALIMSPPNSVGTQVETPESLINIVATDATTAASASTKQSAEPTEPGNSSELLTPPDRSSAVMVVHDASRNTSRVFALTDGDITVSNLSGEDVTPLMGGQTVAIQNGQVGEVEEFDLANFYRTVPLAAGLGPGEAQEAFVAEQPAPVQVTLNAVRVETLAAVRRQEREDDGFTNTFLRDALSGTDSDFDGFRGQSNEVVIDPDGVSGTFVRTGENTATFTPDDNPENVTDFEVDFDDQSITINDEAGISNQAGLSGNDAVGQVILRGGRVIRIEVFDVGGDEPDEDVPYRGRLTNGIAPDR